MRAIRRTHSLNALLVVNRQPRLRAPTGATPSHRTFYPLRLGRLLHTTRLDIAPSTRLLVAISSRNAVIVRCCRARCQTFVKAAFVAVNTLGAGSVWGPRVLPQCRAALHLFAHGQNEKVRMLLRRDAGGAFLRPPPRVMSSLRLDVGARLDYAFGFE
jgi:hypothetical protein